jgi:hypothetical protein
VQFVRQRLKFHVLKIKTRPASKVAEKNPLAAAKIFAILSPQK